MTTAPTAVFSFCGHSLGAHTEAFHAAADADSDDEDDTSDQSAIVDAPAASTATVNAAAVSATCDVCLIAPLDGLALLHCGHSRFSMTCADTVLQPWTMAVPSADRRLPVFCVCLHNISYTDILARTVSGFYTRHVIKHANVFTLQ